MMSGVDSWVSGWMKILWLRVAGVARRDLAEVKDDGELLRPFSGRNDECKTGAGGRLNARTCNGVCAKCARWRKF